MVPQFSVSPREDGDGIFVANADGENFSPTRARIFGRLRAGIAVTRAGLRRNA
jgi:hypothetical protein